MATSKPTRHQYMVANGHRSGLEDIVAAQFAAAGVSVQYEAVKLRYVRPQKPTYYLPDFILPNGIVVETKGRFVTADRQKHRHIQDQWPDIDIRFVFSRSSTRLSKLSKTTYADWCDKLGFTHADKLVPASWMTEPVNTLSLDAIRRAMKGNT